MMETQCHQNTISSNGGNSSSNSRASSVSPGLAAPTVPVSVSDDAQYTGTGSQRGSSVSPVQLTELVPPSGMYKTFSPPSDSNHNVTTIYGYPHHHHHQQHHSNDDGIDYRMGSDRVAASKDSYAYRPDEASSRAYMDHEGKVLANEGETYSADSPGLYGFRGHLKDSATTSSSSSLYHQQLQAAAAFPAGADGVVCKIYNFSTTTTPEARGEFSSPGEAPVTYIHADNNSSITYSTPPSAVAGSPDSSAHGCSPAEDGRSLVIITTSAPNNRDSSTVLEAAAAVSGHAGCNNRLPSQREDFAGDVHVYHHRQHHQYHSDGSTSSSTHPPNYFSDEQSVEGDSIRDIQQEILSADIERHIYENYAHSHLAAYQPDEKDSFDDGSENTSPTIAQGGSSQKNSVSPPKKRRRRSQTPVQRSAANMRERKRMCHLNVAFDRLKDRLPNVRNRKKLSRIQTLRAAIFYINLLSDCVQTTP